MKYTISVLLLGILSYSPLLAQRWVDTAYGYQQLANEIVYGTAPDVAGNQRELKMNLCVPVGDVPPPCGRPLLVYVHGGGFIGGDKTDGFPVYAMRNFAKRGYVAVSINYRLGVFQTSSNWHCNITQFGLEWDCLNAADTAEWYRASYRALQDTRAAIRYLVNNAALYNIDPRNIFVAGESAGGITALNVAFLDLPSEKPIETGALPNVLPPNSVYEQRCIQGYGLDTNIASMKFQRPDLGSIDGNLNPTTIPYTVKGVGSYFGGSVVNFFSQNAFTKAPVVYLYHQPNDLIVPYNIAQIYQGFAYCATQFPANCAWLLNRPIIYGSSAINKILNSIPAGPLKPVVQFDSTSNNAPCLTQINNPSQAGHRIDNTWLRTNNMAKLFATNIDTTGSCTNGIYRLGSHKNVTLHPNPTHSTCIIKGIEKNSLVIISDMYGKTILSEKVMDSSLLIDLNQQAPGLYFVSSYEEGMLVKTLKLIKQ